MGWIILSLMVGPLDEGEIYEITGGNITWESFSSTAEVWHLGDMVFQHRESGGEGSVLEVTLDVPMDVRFVGELPAESGEEHFFLGMRDETVQFADIVGPGPINVGGDLDFLAWDWLPPEHKLEPRSAPLRLQTHSSSIPEPHAWKMFLAILFVWVVGVACGTLA